MNYLKLSAASAAMLALCLLAGCGEKTAATTGQVAEAAGTHAGHAVGGEKRTHFAERSELFVEFPALVVGQPATFVAHFTWLADFKPVREGRLSLRLTGANGTEEQFVAAVSAVPGIFKPVVTPKVAGTRELTLIVDTGDAVLTHALGQVQVFADANAARANPAASGADDGVIPFSKEQQWKIDFATVAAVKGVARSSASAIATIRATPDGEAFLAAPTAGMVRAAGSFPRVGQAVKKGQVLAWLAPRLGGDTDQATLEAGAGKARIALAQARRERERMEALFKDEAVAEKRLLEARASEAMAQADADAAQARAGQFGGSIGKPGGIAVRAPIDGVIAAVSVAAGAFVAEGAPLFHVAHTARLWLEARMPESEIGRLGTPEGAAFAVDGFTRPFVIEPGKNGKLIGVGGAVDAATRTVPVIFEFANPGGSLRLGMMAKAQIFSGGTQAAVLVPASAVQDESGTQVAYLQQGGESFERRIVQTGSRDGDSIAILAGIEPGQRVVSRGAYLVRLSRSMAAPVGHGH